MTDTLTKAIEISADSAAINRIADLIESERKHNAAVAFAEAMNQVQKNMPDIVKDANNSQTRSKYVLYETLSDKLAPIYTEHGFSVSFNTSDSPMDTGPGENGDRQRYMRILAKVMHNAGHSVDYQMDLPIDDRGAKGQVNKTQQHGTGSTCSYGRRYLTLMAFNVPIKGEDNDGNTPTVRISQEEADKLRQEVADCGGNESDFLKFAGVERFEDIRQGSFYRLKEAIKGKARKGSAGDQ